MLNATKRHAGANVLHEVFVDGQKIGQRRSAHAYNYVFLKRLYGGGYSITRWSRNPDARGNERAVRVEGNLRPVEDKRGMFLADLPDGTTTTIWATSAAQAFINRPEGATRVRPA